MDSTSISSALESMILTLTIAFNARTSDNFRALVHGVILCLGRPTVTNLARAASGRATKNLTALHRFFSRAKWSVDEVSRVLVTSVLVPLLAPVGAIMAAVDDTTAGKTGPSMPVVPTPLRDGGGPPPATAQGAPRRRPMK